MQALWNGVVIAQSKNTLTIGGVTFFPESTVQSQYLKPSDMKSHPSPWGRINYRDVEVNGSRTEGAAIQYSEVSSKSIEKVATINLKQDKINYSSYIGFTNGVQVKKEA